MKSYVQVLHNSKQLHTTRLYSLFYDLPLPPASFDWDLCTSGNNQHIMSLELRRLSSINSLQSPDYNTLQ